MAKFDLKGMLSERSAQEIDLPEQKTVYRDPEDLIPSKDNFYSTEDTEKLKQSIRALGMELMVLASRERTEKLLISIQLTQIVLMELWIFLQLIQIESILAIIPISKNQTVPILQNIHGRECVEKMAFREEHIT